MGRTGAGRIVEGHMWHVTWHMSHVTFETLLFETKSAQKCQKVQTNSQQCLKVQKSVHYRCYYLLKPRESVTSICEIFTNSSPLGRVGHKVVMSVCLYVCAIGCSFFRPLIGPQITWPDPGLWLINPPSLPYGGGGGGAIKGIFTLSRTLDTFSLK